MKNKAENKLEQIADVWNCFILEYKYCQNKIKFTEESKTNYFGDILGYFTDTFPIIYNRNDLISNSNSEIFSHHISLLQSIYVHQDFIEELLIIFKCNISKGTLKLDSNYSINRELRNELVGHPIRRLKGELISSCLFGYDTNLNKILYLRYHKDKNYKFEKKEYEVSEIISRHDIFLNKYFDVILDKLKEILIYLKKEIENFEKISNKKSFEDILKLTSIYYEKIFKLYYIYDIESLKIIYDKRNVHNRYQNLINKFYDDLKVDIIYTKDYIQNFIESEQKEVYNNYELPIINYEILFSDSEDSDESSEISTNYNYELGKLATKRNPTDFKFFSYPIRTKCVENKAIMDELIHMENNIHNEIEYYCSYSLLRKELGED
ncbi:hypothetical protein D1631_10080 [Chryseobacterium nematophagum]|uniref:Uncharacterized protein n=1 Tax=Chryseobacterium nematophagum TaxID=2305228 RepID=A0A3M7TF84_9FLAO|nr:hypothetical protein [Chryseobacterium nematophagum]RNA62252.1 hypothetical protein D1631_10080 [Chryseobacterium nematophagum]